jgi:hypothetical protein
VGGGRSPPLRRLSRCSGCCATDEPILKRGIEAMPAKKKAAPKKKKAAKKKK